MESETITRETIIYNGKSYHRYPESKRRQLRVYFWRHDKWKEPPFALHRQIWIDNFGEIPEGYVVHHKDENTLNNEICNLECMSRYQHNSNHMLKEERRKLSQETGRKQSERIKKELREWRINNPEKAHEVYSANGYAQAERATKSLKKWHDENPEKVKQLAIENGKRGSDARWGKNRKSI